MQKRLLVSLSLVAMLLLSACGGNSSHGNVPETTNQMSQPSQPPQRVAVTGADFRTALNKVGYLEEDEYDAKYSGIVDSAGYNSQALYDAVMADGIVGYMYSDDDLGDIPGMRQYLYYELNNLIWEDGRALYTWGDFIFYIVFSDESAAISAIESMRTEFEDGYEISFTEKTDDHYLRLTAQENNGVAVMARVDNTCICFMGTIDCPGYQVFDILGY